MSGFLSILPDREFSGPVPAACMADGARSYYFSAEQTASELPCLSLCFRWLKRRGISICKEIIDMADFRVQKTLGDAQVLHRPWWLLLWDAARGIEHDYTQGALSRSILLLAVPMVLEMAMESIFVVVDIFWVSHLGPDAVAVVGLTESMMVMVYTLAMGLSIGAAAVVARHFRRAFCALVVEPDGRSIFAHRRERAVFQRDAGRQLYGFHALHDQCGQSWRG